MVQPTIHEAEFIRRPNRFLGIVGLNGEEKEVFIPNPGRMYELMIPGKRVYLRENIASHRKTDYDMIAVHHDGVLISIDSNLPNQFMKESLLERRLPLFGNYDHVKPEPAMYGGRFDFLLSSEDSMSVIEVKSCTLVVKGRAIFPDAPTIRGARHVKHLVRALEEDVVNHAYIVFVIQRPDVRIFSPNDPTDPTFSENLRLALAAGVDIIPMRTELVNWELQYLSTVPYDLEYFKREK